MPAAPRPVLLPVLWRERRVRLGRGLRRRRGLQLGFVGGYRRRGVTARAFRRGQQVRHGHLQLVQRLG
jgi:hypothetical protein